MPLTRQPTRFVFLTLFVPDWNFTDSLAGRCSVMTPCWTKLQRV